MRAWLPLAIALAVAVCLYGLLLGVVLGGSLVVGSAPPPLRGPPGGGVVAALAEIDPSPALAGVPAGGASAASGDPALAATWLGGAGASQALASRLAADHPELPAAARQRLAAAVAERSLAWRLDPWLIYAVIQVESGFDASMVGAAGEIGLMQVLPSTAELVARDSLGLADLPRQLLFDPGWNVRLGTAYLASMLREFHGDVAHALAAYNAGDSVPGPTRYSATVLAVYQQVRPRGGR